MLSSKKNCLLSAALIISIGAVWIAVFKVQPKEINIIAHKERINTALSNNSIESEKDIVLKDKDPNILQVKRVPEFGSVYDKYDENKVIFVMDTKEEEYINYSNVIYGYNIDTNEVNEITRAVDIMRYIKNVVSDDGWIFWVEDKDKYDSDAATGEDWKMYCKNLNDNKTILIDKWNGEKEAISGCSWLPSNIFVKDGVVVYTSIAKMDGDDTYYNYMNLYNIKSENKSIIDKVKFNNNRFSKPCIDEGKVVYTAYEIQNSQYINSQIRIFDLNTKESMK